MRGGTHWPGEVPAVAILGAAVPGKDLVVAALRYGHPVRLFGPEQDALVETRRHVDRQLRRLAQNGQLHGEPEAFLKGLSLHTEVTEAVADVAVVLDATHDAVEVRAERVGEVAKAAPDATLLLNVTTEDPAPLTAPAPASVVCHFTTPTGILPFVEIATRSGTPAASLEAATRFCRSLGKEVAVYQGQPPGLVVTRVQATLFASAAAALGERTAAAVDAGHRELGFTIGPCELMDIVGLDRVQAVLAALEIGVPASLASAVGEGRLGRRSGGGLSSDDEPDEVEPADPWPILTPALTEAARLVDAGLAGPATIDRALRLGAGFPGGAGSLVARHGTEAVAKLAEAQGLDAAPLSALAAETPHSGVEVLEGEGLTVVRLAEGHSGNRLSKAGLEALDAAISGTEGPIVLTGEGRFLLHPRVGPLPEAIVDPLRLRPSAAILFGPLGDGAMSLARACRRRVARIDAAIGTERPVQATRAVELELVDAVAHPLLVPEAVAEVLADVAAVSSSELRGLLQS